MVAQSYRKGKCICGDRPHPGTSQFLDQGVKVCSVVLHCQSLKLCQKIYKADGDAHSWDWLALVLPCVNVLRRLASHINGDLSAHQGLKHTIPDLEKDVNTLMESLREHKVYTEKAGRVLDATEKPTVDIMSAGLAALSHGTTSNPLAEFNEQFDHLHDRCCLAPISTLINHPNISIPTSHPILMQGTNSNATVLAVSDVELPATSAVLPLNTEINDSECDEPEGDYQENLFAESPTLT